MMGTVKTYIETQSGKVTLTRALVTICLTLGLHSTLAQETEVMALGTFHFNFPNLDVKKIGKEDQIDVFEIKYQEEIKEIVKKLAKFAPTIIAIERRPDRQKEYDSLYRAYLDGTHRLTRNEEQQIGFRLAKNMGLKKLYCVDEPGRHYNEVQNVLEGKDSIQYRKFMAYFYKNPDTGKKSYAGSRGRPLYKTKGILAHLIRSNQETRLMSSLGDYTIGIFKYTTEDNPHFGPDFVSGWWFNRNLKILRNIQKIPTQPDDRILVIFGAGHMNILNLLFKASPEYNLISVNDYLKD